RLLHDPREIRDLRLARTNRDLLGVVEAHALGQRVRVHGRGDGTEEVRSVVEELELETRRLADDLADLLEGLLVLAGDLDDDVLVARADGGLAQPELVDAATDRVLGLLDGALAD